MTCCIVSKEITLQQIMAHLDSIRKDMVILEKSEFANLRAENEVLIFLIKQWNCDLGRVVTAVHFCGTKYKCKSNDGYFYQHRGVCRLRVLWFHKNTFHVIRLVQFFWIFIKGWFWSSLVTMNCAMQGEESAFSLQEFN